MSEQPRSERDTQNRIVALFTDPTHPNHLGYHYLGDWSNRVNNRAIEKGFLRDNLKTRGYSESQISAALQKLESAADLTHTTLYHANLRTYKLLRYGVPVQTAAGQAHETVHLVDWDHPENNDFALAEEVTVKEGYERRPDIVLYLNGLAVAVIELKRSSVEIGDGILQLITNQEDIFNEPFFSTVQLLFAGNDSQGLRYGTTRTREQFFVRWKNYVQTLEEGVLLDLPLIEMCNKAWMLDFIQNFIVFDAGLKKVPRPHQFFGVKAAQARIKKREGGVIWHTQGSGKSIVMVLLAKWLLEHDPDGRVLVVTDRDELDRQIEDVMKNAEVVSKDTISPRVTSRAQFIESLSATSPRLLCALVHKFDTTDLHGDPPPISGNFYVFVDECHRTQGGNMNRQMKRWMKGAIFIGFTATPLLREDRRLTRSVFGTYIHTYKFHEGVADNVILDLKYRARNVPQRLTSQADIDQWFEQKTKGLNNFQKALIRQRWATMRELMSAGERKQRIIADIIQDFSIKPRLNNDRGTAILVTSSIHDACHYYRLFQNTNFGCYCGIITSYEPNQNKISRERTDSDERYKFETYTRHVLSDRQSTEKYEEETKRRFIEEPAEMKLLIVVSKLLTGFDAPSCTYIYLDNELHDHHLFQAICRTNRLDGDDKEYGHIIDYKELFSEVQEAIAIYNSDELDTDPGSGGSNNVYINDWLVESRRKLDETREALHYLCEPVQLPRETEQYLHYFCGDASDPNALNETEVLRISLYKAVATYVRAFASIAQDLKEAGYSDSEATNIRKEVEFYSEIRSTIKIHSDEELDIKPYEADMRHLLNTYVQADSSTVLGDLNDMSLIEAIVNTGIHDAVARKLNKKSKLSNNAVAEGIIHNVRKTIVRDKLTDPQFYKQMSTLLDDLIKQSREDAVAYEEFLRQADALVNRIVHKKSGDGAPTVLFDRPEAAVIYNNLPMILSDQAAGPAADNEDKFLNLALQIDRAMREQAPAGWKGDQARESQVLSALYPLMNSNPEHTRALFDLIKNQRGYQ